ncbi:MAG: UvrB/UvrC motif-containing protein, partial [Planctomycetota bacterium]|nr:UvrB/UvrC motif-containing protein [Planctomycetota bacterium]
INTYHGLLQFECDGRPDGARPHGREFALDYYEEKKRRADASGSREPFRLSHQECQELFDESAMTYHRYVLLLQIGDYDRVIRDTERNMRIFRFVHEHGELAEDRDYLEKWWPYILRIHYTARAMKKAAESDFAGAVAEVRECAEKIEALPPMDDETFRVEKKRSMDALAEMEKAFRERLTVAPAEEDEIARLEREKAEAVRRQDYERAAELRDEIRRLRRLRGQDRGQAREKGPEADPERGEEPAN